MSIHHRIASAALALTAAALLAQSPDEAKIEVHGDTATLSVETFRPLDATATALGYHYGISISAEDPLYQFTGDMQDMSLEVPRLRPGTFVPKRRRLEIPFAVNPEGQPRDVRALLASVIAAANAQTPFLYRLDEDHDVFAFVPTRTRDPQGRSIAITPLLDRLVTIPFGARPLHESAELMARDLSLQTGLRVSCCQSMIGGYPWGMEKVSFGATAEPARSVLKRLGLYQWHVRCDLEFCFIEMR